MVSRGVLREYVRGSLWVLPTLSVLAALAAGALLSSVSIGPRSPLAFQGTPDDARTLLLGISGTMVTVIALLLGLAVVALQLSSTQFSPRLLRNFLRDRPNQVVLSAFVATFAYSGGDQHPGDLPAQQSAQLWRAWLMIMRAAGLACPIRLSGRRTRWHPPIST